jgi:hypothetical protein
MVAMQHIKLPDLVRNAVTSRAAPAHRFEQIWA